LVVFKRKTLPKGNFPKGILIAANEKGWINQDIMKVWVEKDWRKRKQSLLIMDSCRAHITDDTERLVSKYSKLAIIPGGLTKKILPLDFSVNLLVTRCTNKFNIQQLYALPTLYLCVL
jgi:hypothetical protein